jgi:putative hydrolase of the HAD superfamily
MIDFSQLQLISPTEADREFCYQIKKATMGGYIKQIWGWDETVQRQLFDEDWQQKKPQIILYNNRPIGTIFLSWYGKYLEIERFYLLPEYQKQGIGSYLLKDILDKADETKITAKLGVLKINPAQKLYQRFSFVAVGENELAFFMERKPKHKYKAVIFDLGGTLSRSAAWSEYANAARKMAEICIAPADEFIEQWFANSGGLGTGVYKTWQDYIRYVCHLMNLNVPDNHVEAAAAIALSVTRDQICTPREGAIELLSYLKSNGYKLGLISDCFYDVPEIWPETPFAPYFDMTIFSCSVGMNKADPRIFQIAVETLAVKPENCIYIADGMRNELINAEKLGMHSVQILIPDEIYDSPIREDWHGPVISSLKEVLNLLSI